jgi:chemotaxis protein MotB
MRRSNDKHGEIIIKRRAKKDHGEAHGGAWKVAFADFTLAMMALFMVLWIIQPQADDERKKFNEDYAPTIFQSGVGIFHGTVTKPIVIEWDQKERNGLNELKPKGAKEKSESQQLESEADLKSLQQVMQALAQNDDATGNLEVQVVPQGLRIVIKDDEQRFMFERGNASLNPHFETLLSNLAKILNTVDNKLIVSGHTDGTPYRNKTGYDNWDLSGERALRARTALVGAGLSSTAFLQVSAQADGAPIRPEDPHNGANRRVEILMLTTRAETVYRELFGQSYARYSSGGVDFVEAKSESADTQAPL